MAHDNETNTLELHIKVNGPNLSAISEKCNISTLRIPADPSWPKIPPRRSSNNTDIIEPPCVVTLTGIPRKGRSIVQTVACQHLKSRLNQKYEAATHASEKLPGCFDPRFRRQISRQKAEKSDKFCITKNDKQTPELDTHIPQGTKKLEEKSRETDENANSYIPPCHDVDHLLSSVTKPAKATDDLNEQSTLEVKHCTTTSQYTTNERYDVGNKFSQEQKQEINRPLLLMVDEKKIHALPINPLNIEATRSSAQCYSVQIPVVAYHNVPLQVSSMPTRMNEDVKIPYVRQNDKSVKAGEIIGDICAKSANSVYSFGVFGESRNEKYPLDGIGQCNAKSSDDMYKSEKKSIPKHLDERTSGRIRDKEMVGSNDNVSTNQNITNETTLRKDRYGSLRFDASDDAGDADNGESYSNFRQNTAARLKNLAGQSCASDSYITDGCDEKRMSNENVEGELAKAWMRSCVNARKRRLACRVKEDDRDKRDADSHLRPSTNAINEKNDKLERGMQSLVIGEVCDKGCDKGKKEKCGEPRINWKRKAAPTNLSRKAKSFLRKRSRLAIADSDCTLILPGHRGIKGKRYEKSRLKVSRSLRGKNGITGANSMPVKYNASRKGRSTSRSLTNLRAGNSFEKPSSIPLETQELLNKSYWEYYWKLGRKIASVEPDNAEEGGKRSNEDHLPESQTLRQCSVLSCMINTALGDSATADGGPSPDRNLAANVASNARESVYEASEGLSTVFARKMKRKTMRRASERSLGLRAIALLCIAMYIAVIFLPMLYDYFFDEEYDDENASYIELTFQYVASSFGEALDGIVNLLTTILLRPVRFDRKR